MGERPAPRGRPGTARRVIGRRALFFWAASLVCVALVPATPSDLRWVTWLTAGIGFFWAVVLSAEDLLRPTVARRERSSDRPGPPEPESPFGPPPPPGGSTG